MSRTFVLGIGLFAVLLATGEGLKGAMEQILEANMNPDPNHSPPGKHLSFYQGDIRLTKKQTENLKKYGDPTKNSADSRAASSVDKERWPNAVIPYTFDCSIDPCMDKNGNCPAWKQSRACQSSPDIMKEHCKHSCNFCNAPPTQPPTPPPSQTTTTQSPPTQPPQPPTGTGSPATGSPTASPPTSIPSGKATGLRCVDKSTRCPGYSQSQCDNSGWILRNCRKTCNAKCDKTPLKPTGSCADLLGLGWDNKFPDSAFTASSQLSPGGGWWALPSNARLYFEDDYDNKRIGSWCAVDRSPQWLKIDLGQMKTITGIASQGRDVFVEHVKKYELAFSSDGSTWKNYEENGRSKVFDGNCDNFTPVLNRFNPVKARYVEVLPHDSPSTWVCMRVELYGCDA